MSFPYKCNICNQVFIKKYKWKNHIRSHTSDNPHQCANCGLFFFTEEKLKKHFTEDHNPDRKYPCRFCGKYLARKSSLNIHLKRHLNKCEHYNCDTCDSVYSTKDGLRKHWQRIHMRKNEMQLECKYCKAYYNSKGKLFIFVLLY